VRLRYEPSRAAFRRTAVLSSVLGHHASFDPASIIAERAKAIDASGIRKVFDLAATMKDPINLSIGQPDFDVPDAIKQRAIEAIENGRNRYTPTQGIADLVEPVRRQVEHDTGWKQPGVMILSGTSGGIMLAMFACLNPGDEVIFLDPYFVMYKHLPKLVGAIPISVDSYPDFRLNAKTIEAAVTSRSRMLVICSPNNPTGVAYTTAELEAVADVARRHGLVVLSDEIYDAFCYQPHVSIAPMLPDQCILLKGYSKTYAMTGWRLGYGAGPKPIIDQMIKLQQYTFVCAPSPAQYAALELLHSHTVDMRSHIDEYRRRRDRMIEGLGDLYPAGDPQGAFYIFARAPGSWSGSELVRRAISKNVLLIPGSVFSDRDTHFRISYAASRDHIEKGIAVLRDLALQAEG
jgi:aspartate aminotransferase/aminotransferase